MSDKKIFIGVDIGGTNIKGVVLGEGEDILHQKSIPTQSEKGPDGITRRIVSLIKGLAKGGQLDPTSPRAVGVAVAGAVDMQGGRCKFMTNFPLKKKWTNFPLAEKIRRGTGSDVFLINDVRATTLAEKIFGAGKEAQNMICIAIGTGIGGGIVIQSQLYFGSEGFAGEIGHQTIQLNGPVCGCGNAGCFEALASGPNLTSEAIRLIKEGKTTLIRQLVGGDLNKISPQVIARAAREGDDVARSIWEKEAFYLGTGIANLVSILNPEMIVIGGGVAGALDIMEEKIRKTLRERVYLGAEVDKLRIVKGKLGDIAGAVGAACWAMQSSGK